MLRKPSPEPSIQPFDPPHEQHKWGRRPPSCSEQKQPVRLEGRCLPGLFLTLSRPELGGGQPTWTLSLLMSPKSPFGAEANYHFETQRFWFKSLQKPSEFVWFFFPQEEAAVQQLFPTPTEAVEGLQWVPVRLPEHAARPHVLLPVSAFFLGEIKTGKIENLSFLVCGNKK